MPAALIGVDVGTTNIKVVAYDTTGATLAAASRAQDVHHPRPGWAEYDPHAMFDKTASALREVTAQLEGREVAGIAIASMAETAVPIDSRGDPVFSAIAWHDERTAPQATWWRETFGEEATYSVTGLPVLPIFGVHKMRWLRENEPEAFDRMRLWLNTADYVAYRLSGEAATDYSLASRMMLLDLESRTWSDTMLAHADLSPERFAPLRESGSVLGTVGNAASQVTGLAAGTPAVVGGHDHPCGALALGVAHEGDVLDSIGTSESVLTVTEQPHLSAAVASAGYQQGVHVVPGSYYCNGGLYTAGAAIEWARNLLSVDTDADLATLLDRGARRGVFFLPHLRLASPPNIDPLARAGFIGIDADTSRADLARAVVDGLAFEAQQSLDGMEALLGFTTERMRAIGGGSRIEPLLRTKASLLGRDVQIASTEEATSLGAAMLAGVGSGTFEDVDEASREMAPTWRTVEPDATETEWLTSAYEGVFKRLYDTLAPLHHAIPNLPAPPPKRSDHDR